MSRTSLNSLITPCSCNWAVSSSFDVGLSSRWVGIRYCYIGDGTYSRVGLLEPFYYYYYLQPTKTSVFFCFIYTVLYSAICRPSDCTVGMLPGPWFEPRTGSLESGTLTTRPPHLHISKSIVAAILVHVGEVTWINVPTVNGMMNSNGDLPISFHSFTVYTYRWN